MLNKIEEYFKTPAISNSLLNAVQNPRWLKIKMDNPDMEDEEKAHFRIGSCLDCLLTTPELFEDSFVIISSKRPAGLMAKFIESLPSGLDILSDNSLYQEAYDKAGYKAKLETIIAKLWANPELVNYYFDITVSAKDKIIISKDEYEQVIKAKELLLANEFTKPYFFPEEGCELLSQVPIYFKCLYSDLDNASSGYEECKALLDGIIINHDDKTIQPYDLKTTGKSVYSFKDAFLEYGYYRQAAFYDWAIRQPESPVREYLKQGYQILDFKFIVVETKVTSSHPAIIYEVTDDCLQMGRYGDTIGNRYYKGIFQLIKDYQFHKENNYWDMPKSLYENKGIIKLEVFK